MKGTINDKRWWDIWQTEATITSGYKSDGRVRPAVLNLYSADYQWFSVYFLLIRDCVIDLVLRVIYSMKIIESPWHCDITYKLVVCNLYVIGKVVYRCKKVGTAGLENTLCGFFFVVSQLYSRLFPFWRWKLFSFCLNPAVVDCDIEIYLSGYIIEWEIRFFVLFFGPLLYGHSWIWIS